jgi:hypothetical protein
MMSSFPDHEENILKLEAMGFKTDALDENGDVTMESWGYDELVYVMRDIINELQKQDFIKTNGT